jgi:hypothetical protein
VWIPLWIRVATLKGCNDLSSWGKTLLTSRRRLERLTWYWRVDMETGRAREKVKRGWHQMSGFQRPTLPHRVLQRIYTGNTVSSRGQGKIW